MALWDARRQVPNECGRCMQKGGKDCTGDNREWRIPAVHLRLSHAQTSMRISCLNRPPGISQSIVSMIAAVL
jgi:hypothetical protein